MLLSRLQKKLKKYDTDPDVGKGVNRKYGTWFTCGGDRTEIKYLRKFITDTLVENRYKDVDVTFLDFMDYLIEHDMAHNINYGALYFPGSVNASVNLVLKPWFNELSKKEKKEVRNKIGEALTKQEENRSFLGAVWCAFWDDSDTIESTGGPYHRLYM